MCVRQGCLLLMILYNIAVEVLANFANADKRIKGIQIGDHGIKIVNFAGNIIIFLKDITCLNRIQVILKPYENARINWFNDNLAEKIIFSKRQAFMGCCK